jgi:hypothetical protein
MALAFKSKCREQSLVICEKIIARSMSVPKTITSGVLFRLYTAGFRKLIPFLPDSSTPNVYDNLITDEEFRSPYAEGRPARVIYQNPNFWSEARLKEKSHLFYNVATTFGLTDLKDSKRRPLYLYGVDVDSRQAYEALRELIQTLKGITYVVKSHKDYGYHFYILSPMLHEPLGLGNFKLGTEIEVKTDMSLGSMHLPPSRHRRHSYWNYTRVSTAENIYIDEEDAIFPKIMKGLYTFYLLKDSAPYFLKLHKMINAQVIDEKEIINVLKIANSKFTYLPCKCGLISYRKCPFPEYGRKRADRIRA